MGNRLFHSAHKKKGASTLKPIEITRPERPGRKGRPAQPPAKKKRLATSEEMLAFFGGGAIHYTGGRRRARCERGHFIRPGSPCARCAAHH